MAKATLNPRPAGVVAEGLGDVGLADTDGAVEDDRLGGLDEAEGSQVLNVAAGSLGL